jgi:hypothetical protein
MATLTPPLAGVLTQVGLVNPPLERLRAGRNSRVWRVEGPDRSYILKEYFRHPGDPRDRLATEYGFLAFLQAQGVTAVPLPLAQDRRAQVALYSHLPGTPVRTIQPHHIQQAAQFIHRVNQVRDREIALPPASEACFSLADHLQGVERRLQGLQTALEDCPNRWYLAAKQLLVGQLWPTYQRLGQQLQANWPAAELGRPLELDQRILSPSDFGFHNMLEADGTLAFLDFEYAGWDDPAKLICDFASQPQCPVSRAQAEAFGAQLGAWLPGAQGRAALLLPLHRLKWCCILLNEFRAQDRQRRYHAGDDQAERLETQLHKAQTYFDQHLGETLGEN